MKLPKLGDSISDATIVKMYKSNFFYLNQNYRNWRSLKNR